MAVPTLLFLLSVSATTIMADGALPHAYGLGQGERCRDEREITGSDQDPYRTRVMTLPLRGNDLSATRCFVVAGGYWGNVNKSEPSLVVTKAVTNWILVLSPRGTGRYENRLEALSFRRLQPDEFRDHRVPKDSIVFSGGGLCWALMPSNLLRVYANRDCLRP